MPDRFEIDIWTDGACTYNGTAKAKAAWAFVVSVKDQVVEKAGMVEGKQTNNRAEAFAIYHALLWAGTNGFTSIKIHTDSQITMHGVNKPAFKVKMNRDIFERIAFVIFNHQLVVSYKKVIGHGTEENNNRADRLANTKAMMP
ncbi:MAG: reverse transcriptase-like protein [Candidatus Levybacteria bacterium]|nr:reverse transcriptase-like protein [Candidatus Levybacteria bacterium]